LSSKVREWPHFFHPAIRLSKAFGGSPESGLIQQSRYDLWQVMQKQDEDVCLKSKRAIPTVKDSNGIYAV
jgi:plasmid maintenance system antidote protein VapI